MGYCGANGLTAASATIRLQALRSVISSSGRVPPWWETIARSQPHTVGRASTGVTADIIINGRQVSSSHPDVRAFKQKCRAFSVTEVLGPSGPNHAPMFTLPSRDRGSVEPPAHRLVVTPPTQNQQPLNL